MSDYESANEDSHEPLTLKARDRASDDDEGEAGDATVQHHTEVTNGIEKLQVNESVEHVEPEATDASAEHSVVQTAADDDAEPAADDAVENIGEVSKDSAFGSDHVVETENEFEQSGSQEDDRERSEDEPKAPEPDADETEQRNNEDVESKAVEQVEVDETAQRTDEDVAHEVVEQVDVGAETLEADNISNDDDDADAQDVPSGDEEHLDDDQDRKNPAFIPRQGPYYLHDSRTTGEDAPPLDARHAAIAERAEKLDKIRRWDHDLYYEDEQKPRSKSEIVNKYGYDIRLSEKPPPEEESRYQRPDNRPRGSGPRTRPRGGRGGRGRHVSDDVDSRRHHEDSHHADQQPQRPQLKPAQIKPLDLTDRQDFPSLLDDNIPSPSSRNAPRHMEEPSRRYNDRPPQRGSHSSGFGQGFNQQGSSSSRHYEAQQEPEPLLRQGSWHQESQQQRRGMTQYGNRGYRGGDRGRTRGGRNVAFRGGRGPPPPQNYAHANGYDGGGGETYYIEQQRNGGGRPLLYEAEELDEQDNRGFMGAREFRRGGRGASRQPARRGYEPRGLREVGIEDEQYATEQHDYSDVRARPQLRPRGQQSQPAPSYRGGRQQHHHPERIQEAAEAEASTMQQSQPKRYSAMRQPRVPQAQHAPADQGEQTQHLGDHSAATVPNVPSNYPPVPEIPPAAPPAQYTPAPTAPPPQPQQAPVQYIDGQYYLDESGAAVVPTPPFDQQQYPVYGVDPNAATAYMMPRPVYPQHPPASDVAYVTSVPPPTYAGIPPPVPEIPPEYQSTNSEAGGAVYYNPQLQQPHVYHHQVHQMAQRPKAVLPIVAPTKTYNASPPPPEEPTQPAQQHVPPHPTSG